MIIPIIPRPSPPLGEEHPLCSALAHIHHDPVDVILLARIGRHGRKVFRPEGRLKPLPGGVADGEVREDVVVAPGDERGGDELPEGVVGARTEDVVGEGAFAAVDDESGVVEEGG